MAEKKRNVIQSAIDFLKKLSTADVAIISFIKKDGTERRMNCTLNMDRIPAKDHPKSVSLVKILQMIQDHGLIRVYDLENNGWRSVRYETCKWANIDGVVYHMAGWR